MLFKIFIPNKCLMLRIKASFSFSSLTSSVFHYILWLRGAEILTLFSLPKTPKSLKDLRVISPAVSLSTDL